MATPFPLLFRHLLLHRSRLLRGLIPVGLCIACGQVSSLAAAADQATEDLVSNLVAASQKHQVVRKSDPAEPARLAETYAVGLADDVSLFNEWMLRIIQAHVKAGRIEDAEYLVTRLPGYGSAMAHAEMALFYAGKKQATQAEAHLKPALKQVDQASGLLAETIRVDCILALYSLERGEETAAQQDKLGKLSLLSLETRLHEENLKQPLSLQDAKKRLQEVPEQGEDERRARFLLACARQHFQLGAADAAVPFLDEIGGMAMQNGLPNAQRVLVDLARVAWMGGQKKVARKSLNLFLKCCESYGDGSDWKPGYIADAADLLISWGDKDEAAEWLKTGAQTIKKVFVLDAPAAILALARQQERLDGAEAADSMVVMAVRAGAMHKHPRSLAEASVRACLYYADAGRAMPEKVSQTLTQLSAEAVR